MSKKNFKESSISKTVSATVVTPKGDGIDKNQSKLEIKELLEPEPTVSIEHPNARLRRTSNVGKRFNLEDLNKPTANGCPKFCLCSKCCTSPKCACLTPGSTCGVLCQKENLLIILTIFGVIFGVILGLSLRHYKRSRNETWSNADKNHVRFIGDLFLGCLKSLILPLVVSSLTSVIGSLDLSLSRRIGIRAIVYYLVTTILAVILGIVLVWVFKPGAGVTLPQSFTAKVNNAAKRNKTEIGRPHLEDSLLDLVRNMFPPNLIQATYATYKTVRYTNGTIQGEFVEEGMNILGLLVFTVTLGVVISKLGNRGYPLLDFATSLGETTLIMTKVLMWFTPIGVCSLIASEFIGPEDGQLFDLFKAMGLYFLTVLAALTLHGTVLLPLLYFFCTRKLPFRFMGRMSQALCTAFGTSSSSATLPITIKCLEEKNGVDPRVARFVLPIGATMNMDGTAMNEAITAICIAQMQSAHLGTGQLITISIAAIAASVVTVGTPQAGVVTVTMVMVLHSIGLDPTFVTYVLPVDWLLDRFRTIINVLGDAFGAVIIQEMSKKELEAMGPPQLLQSYHSVTTDFSKRKTSKVAFPGSSDNELIHESK